MLMLFCAAGEQRSARAVGNQPRGVSGAEERQHVWQHVSLAAAHQHRRQSEEELKRLSVYKPSFRAVPQSSITGSHILTAWVSSVIPHDGVLQDCAICQTLRSDDFSISASSWLQSGKVTSKTITFGTVKLAYCEWLHHLNMRLCKCHNVTLYWKSLFCVWKFYVGLRGRSIESD